MSFIKSILFLCLFAQYGHACSTIREKTDGVFANCENQWCQQQAVYFVQYTLCESVTNWGKTCNNPKIDGNRETDPIGLPIWTRQVDVEEWCGQLGGTHDSHTLGTRTGKSQITEKMSGAEIL